MNTIGPNNNNNNVIPPSETKPIGPNTQNIATQNPDLVKPSIPQFSTPLSGTPVADRNPSIHTPDAQYLPKEMQLSMQNINNIGSQCSALPAILGKSQGKFEIIFQPRDGSPPISLKDFPRHPAVQNRYTDIMSRISQHQNNITFGLLNALGTQQQQLSQLAMQMPNGTAPQHIIESIMHPIIQPMPVRLNDLLAWKDTPIPQQWNNPAMNWQDQEAIPQPMLQPMPQPMLQPSLQHPNPTTPQQHGFHMLPSQPLPAGQGLPLLFSPMAQYMKQQPQPEGPMGLQNLLPQFVISNPLSMLMPQSLPLSPSPSHQPETIDHNSTQIDLMQGESELKPSKQKTVQPVSTESQTDESATDLSQQLSAAKTKRDLTEKAISDINKYTQAIMAEHAEKLQNTEKQIAQAKKDKQDIEAELKKQTAENDNLRSTITTTPKKEETQSIATSTDECPPDTVTVQLNAIQNTLGDILENKDTYDLNAEIKDILAKIENITENNDPLSGINKKYLDILKKIVKELELGLENLSSITKANTTLQELQNQLSDMEQIPNTITHQIKEINSLKEQALENIKQAHSNHAQSDTYIQAATENITSARQILTDASDEHSTSNDLTTAAIQDLTLSLDKTQGYINTSENDINTFKELQNKIHALEETSIKEGNAHDSVVNELNKLKEQMQDIHNNPDTIPAYLTKLNKQTTDIRNTLLTSIANRNKPEGEGEGEGENTNYDIKDIIENIERVQSELKNIMPENTPDDSIITNMKDSAANISTCAKSALRMFEKIDDNSEQKQNLQTALTTAENKNNTLAESLLEIKGTTTYTDSMIQKLRDALQNDNITEQNTILEVKEVIQALQSNDTTPTETTNNIIVIAQHISNNLIDIEKYKNNIGELTIKNEQLTNDINTAAEKETIASKKEILANEQIEQAQKVSKLITEQSGYLFFTIEENINNIEKLKRLQEQLPEKKRGIFSAIAQINDNNDTKDLKELAEKTLSEADKLIATLINTAEIQEQEETAKAEEEIVDKDNAEKNAEKEKLAQEQAEKEKTKKAEEERLAEEAEAEKTAKAAKAAKAEEERLAEEAEAEKTKKAAAEKLEKDKAEQSEQAKKEEHAKAEEERLAEKAETEKAEKAAAEKLEKDKAEQSEKAKEEEHAKAEKDKLAQEQADKETAEKAAKAKEEEHAKAEKDKLILSSTNDFASSMRHYADDSETLANSISNELTAHEKSGPVSAHFTEYAKNINQLVKNITITWHKTQHELSTIEDNYTSPSSTMDIPPDHLETNKDKMVLLRKYESNLNDDLNQISELVNKIEVEHQENTSPDEDGNENQHITLISSLTSDFSKLRQKERTEYTDRVTTISKNIFDSTSCTENKLFTNEKGSSDAYNNISSITATTQKQNDSGKSTHSCITDVINKKHESLPASTFESAITRHLMTPEFKASETWSSINQVVLTPHLTSSTKNDIEDQNPHINGYLSGKVIAASLTAMRIHLYKHSKDADPDTLRNLRSESQKFINLVNPENWGNDKHGKKKSSYISTNAKKWITDYCKITETEIDTHFSTKIGSARAKEIIQTQDNSYSNLNKKITDHNCTSETDEIKVLFKKNPELSKRWLENIIALKKVVLPNKTTLENSVYQLYTQRSIRRLLNEFDIRQQYTVASFLKATMDDIASGDSGILPHLKDYHTTDKTKEGMSKSDALANSVDAFIQIENSLSTKPEIFLRGVTTSTPTQKNNKLIKKDHDEQETLDKFKNTQLAIFKSLSTNSDSGEDLLTLTSGVLRQAFNKDLSAIKFTATGDVYINLDKNNNFTDQGITFRTNMEGNPIEILELRGSTWEVSPAFLLNHPNVTIPFKDATASYIPIVNKDKTTGNESEGLLYIDDDTCYLYTLNDQDQWRCRPVGAQTPDHHAEQKISGYIKLAAATNAKSITQGTQPTEEIKQAFKAYCDLRKLTQDASALTKFRTFCDKGMIQKLTNGFSWMTTSNKSKALNNVRYEINKLTIASMKNSDAYSLFEVKHTTQLPKGAVYTNHPAIIQLQKKLNSQQHGSTFKIIHATRSNNNFPASSLTPAFQLCEQEYIEHLKNEDNDDLIHHMEACNTKFKYGFLKQAETYDAATINVSAKDKNLDDNILAIKRIHSKLSSHKNSLSMASSQIYETLKNTLKTSPMNLSDVDDARKLWIQGKGPTFSHDADQLAYSQNMWHLGQLNWTANQIAVCNKMLTKHEADLAALETIRLSEPGRFKKLAQNLNINLAKITTHITGILSTLDAVGTTENATSCSLYEFLEDRNIQLRPNQLKAVPDLMLRQSNAIINNQKDSMFLMEGTGGGKSLCLEAMVSSSINSMSTTPPENQRRRPILIIAPDNNAKQLYQAIGLNEQRQERQLQQIQIIQELKHSNDKKTWWHNTQHLKSIQNQLLGINKKTVDTEINNEIQKNRSACLLSFSEFQVLQHGVTTALQDSNTPAEAKKLLNEINDSLINGVLFGDECISGILPYTKSDENEILENVNSTLPNDSSIKAHDLTEAFTGVVSNSFIFTGLSATKGTPLMGAIIAQKGSHSETASELQENILTTRLRASSRISRARILRVSNDESAAIEVVNHLSSTQGVTILDTAENEDKAQNLHSNTGKHWGDLMSKARSNKWSDHADSFKMGYINDDGKSMLYDKNNPRYNNKHAYGGALTNAENKLLRSTGAPKMDNTLTLDQGVGSDPIQGLDTAFMITGVFGSTEYGRFDLVEQWLGRGTRSSEEPYTLQSIYLTVTDDDIKKIKQKHQGPDNTRIKELINNYDTSNTSVITASANLEKELKSIHNSKVKSMLSELSKQPLDTLLTNDLTRDTQIKRLTAAAEKSCNTLKSSMQEKQYTAALDALQKYIIAEEIYQLDAKILLFAEIASRDATTYTKSHEDSAIIGQTDSIYKSLFANEKHWMDTEAINIVDKHSRTAYNKMKENFTTILSPEKLTDQKRQLHFKLIELKQKLHNSLISNEDQNRILPAGFLRLTSEEEQFTYIENNLPSLLSFYTNNTLPAHIKNRTQVTESWSVIIPILKTISKHNASTTTLDDTYASYINNMKANITNIDRRTTPPGTTIDNTNSLIQASNLSANIATAMDLARTKTQEVTTNKSSIQTYTDAQAKICLQLRSFILKTRKSLASFRKHQWSATINKSNAPLNNNGEKKLDSILPLDSTKMNELSVDPIIEDIKEAISISLKEVSKSVNVSTPSAQGYQAAETMNSILSAYPLPTLRPHVTPAPIFTIKGKNKMEVVCSKNCNNKLEFVMRHVDTKEKDATFSKNSLPLFIPLELTNAITELKRATKEKELTLINDEKLATTMDSITKQITTDITSAYTDFIADTLVVEANTAEQLVNQQKTLQQN